MKNNSYKRKLSAFLVFILLVGIMQFNTFATTGDYEGVLDCQHVHDEICGYVEAVNGHECEHVHDDECGYIEEKEEVPCDMDCTDIDNDGIIDHAVECGYRAEIQGESCGHVHDENCGYVEAVEGMPCGHVHGPECYKKAEDDDSENSLGGGTGGNEPDGREQEYNSVNVNDLSVTTFDELKKAIDNASGDTVITIENNIEITETLNIKDGQNITITGGGRLYRSESFTGGDYDEKGVFFYGEEGSTLNIDGVTLDGNSVAGYANGFIYSEGTINLTDGVLENINCHGNTHSYSDYTRSAVCVYGKEAEFNMSGGEIRDNIYCEDGLNQEVGVVMAVEGAAFNMTGGVIKDNEMEALISAAVVIFGGTEDGQGGVLDSKDVNSYFNMSGDARIINNKSEHGGVLLGNRNPQLLFTDLGLAVGVMDGGVISGNSTGTVDNAMNYGGGVVVYYHASFTMKNGEISNNSGTMGGGVCVTDAYVESGAYDAGFDYERDWINTYNIPGEFIMEGGVIEGNAANYGENKGDTGCGGGVYIASNKVVLKGGEIKNNTAERQGGGVYVGCVPYVLHMYDTVITDNTADILGGGLWFCPTGDATNAVTNGGAIYGNKAGNGTEAAGDDFVAVPNVDDYSTTLADRMLGGGEVKWYKDGGVYSVPGVGNDVGTADGTPRFDPADPGERITEIKDSKAGLALKSVVTDEAVALAESQAELIISGNSSARGGGVGSNGSIIIGTPEDDYKLKVTKEWDEETAEEDKKEVTVYLKIGDCKLDPVKLNEENGWTAHFEELPNPDSLKGNVEIAVAEDPVPEGYEAEYTEAEIDEDTKTITISVKNNKGGSGEVKDGSLTIKKKVTNGGSKKKDFTFTVYFENADGEPLDGEYPYNGDKTGTIGNEGTFELKHGESITISGLPEGTKYKVVEDTPSGYKLIKHGDIGEIEAGREALAEFENRKKDGGTEIPESVGVILKADKTLDGELPEDGRFTFFLKDKNGNIIDTQTNYNGTVEFDRLNFSKEGTYEYYITEKAETGDGILYDTSEYKAVIEVRENYNGKFIAEVTYEKDGEECGRPLFENKTVEEEISVTVIKEWAGEPEGHNRPEQIAVQLYKDGEPYGRPVILNDKNLWCHTWTGLDKESVWAVDEIDVPEGYEKTVNENGYVFTITNTYTKPEEPTVPEEPTNPEDPEDPDTPDIPENPDEPNEPDITEEDVENPDKDNDTPQLDKTPQTGDSTKIEVWMMLTAVSFAGIVVICALKKMKIFR